METHEKALLLFGINSSKAFETLRIFYYLTVIFRWKSHLTHPPSAPVSYAAQ